MDVWTHSLALVLRIHVRQKSRVPSQSHDGLTTETFTTQTLAVGRRVSVAKASSTITIIITITIVGIIIITNITNKRPLLFFITITYFYI